MHHVGSRNLLKGDHHISLRRLKLIDHPRDDIGLSVESDDRIPQGDHTGLVTDQRTCTEDRVPEPKLPPLTRVKIFHFATFEFQVAQLLFATRLPQIGGQLLVDVEMLFNRRFSM